MRVLVLCGLFILGLPGCGEEAAVVDLTQAYCDRVAAAKTSTQAKFAEAFRLIDAERLRSSFASGLGVGRDYNLTGDRDRDFEVFTFTECVHACQIAADASIYGAELHGASLLLSDVRRLAKLDTAALRTVDTGVYLADYVDAYIVKRHCWTGELGEVNASLRHFQARFIAPMDEALAQCQPKASP